MTDFTSFDTKDPDDIDKFTWSFADWLDTGESINGSSFPDFPSGLTLDSSSDDATSVTATISGGTAGESYDVTCRVTTDGGRTKDITGTIPVAET
jgi:hypothetical protein